MTPEYQHDLLQLCMFLTSLLANVWLALGWSESRKRVALREKSVTTLLRENSELTDKLNHSRVQVKAMDREIRVTDDRPVQEFFRD